MKKFLYFFALFCLPGLVHAQSYRYSQQQIRDARPWVFWYWMQGGVSRAGITADLKAMKQAGIGGAYLMPIKGPANPPVFNPAAQQLSPLWWEMIRYSFQEASRLGMQLGMHVSDGFALAGGPWISPALSMQKVVSSEVHVTGGRMISMQLPQPETRENYYKDIAVYAYPAAQEDQSSEQLRPLITSSTQVKLSTLAGFKSDQPCWVQYEFNRPFTCRSILVGTAANNFQAQRLLLQVSDNGMDFRPVCRLHPPRHGWQDTDADVTHSIPEVTARYFRFVYDPAGTEPGAEDLDAAKWKPVLKLSRLILSSAARINQFEGKNGQVWRISESSTKGQLPDSYCIPLHQLINLSKNIDAKGRLTWQAPEGGWNIIRMGHTSTGHTNATGGGGAGLEVDKFNAAAIGLQFDSWYGRAIREAGPVLAKKVLHVFHVDSWECGSQNWSDNFPAAFKKRRGYDLLPWLPVMSGIPVGSAARSEAVLHDIRQTIADLVVDTFYQTLAKLAKDKGVVFTAESVAPTMISDGMMHYKTVDVPMGEFWLNSPTHDKPNDMLDAISGAHIYGKPVIQAEAFTTLRMAWNEYPAMLKTLQDRNYALGINKLVYHVFTHNPWMDRKPGMTLNGVGLYFQRDQTWWKPGRAWVDYATRCQLMLQRGKPVTDIAVFTGEEYPRRAVLPEHLVYSLPGIFGSIVQRDATRLQNMGEPLAETPKGVFHSANISDPADWTDPLHGYSYDSFNPDVLMGAKVRNHRVVFPSGANYAILVFPSNNPMDPNGKQLSAAVREKIISLRKAGAQIIVTAETGPYQQDSFEDLGMAPDLLIRDLSGKAAPHIAWNHRVDGNEDIYFISNQEAAARQLAFSFRIKGKKAVLYNAVDNQRREAVKFSHVGNRTLIPLRLEPDASLFVIFQKNAGSVRRQSHSNNRENWPVFKLYRLVPSSWKVTFDPRQGGPLKTVSFPSLTDWSKDQDSLIRYYSGTAVYRKSLTIKSIPPGGLWLNLGKVANLATVSINGKTAGTLWTYPFRLDISRYLKTGNNELEIEVTNTWANRLMGDQRLPESQRITRTTAPYRLAGMELQEAGLLGPVRLETPY